MPDLKVNVVKPGELQKAKELRSGPKFDIPVASQQQVISNPNYVDLEKPQAAESRLDSASYQGLDSVNNDNYDFRKSHRNQVAPELLDSMYEELKYNYHSLIRRRADLQGRYHGMVEENCEQLDKEIELAKNEYRVFCNIHNLPFR